MKLEELTIDMFADGADINDMKNEYVKGVVKGFTTNPSLMKKAGVKDYVQFAHEVLREIPDMPISFEVFSNDFDTMAAEARELCSWGDNVYVKIPISNADGESSIPLVRTLSAEGLKLNVTAIFTIKQVEETVAAFAPGTENIVSVFAGRIADTGVDPTATMKQVADICATKPGTRSLWASCREVYSIIQAQECGCDIITVTYSVLNKLHLLGKDLGEYSLETVKSFVSDGASLGFNIL